MKPAIDNWNEEFDRPIPLPDGGLLVTLRDDRDCRVALVRAQRRR